MSDRIGFDLNSYLTVENGSSFEHISNCLQYFTNEHLYIENNKLKSVKNVTHINIGFCEVIEVNVGYLLREKETGNLYRVLSIPLMKFLTTQFVSQPPKTVFEDDYESDDSWILETTSDSIEEVPPNSVDDISEEYNTDESLEYNTVEEINQEETSEDQEEESTQEEPTPEKNLEENLVEQDLEETLEETQVEPALEETQVEPALEETQVEPALEETQVEPALEETQVEPALEETQVEPALEETHKIPEISLEQQERIWFRMFLKFEDDSIYINKKILKTLEDSSNIDIENTIKTSFEIFLKDQGFLKTQISIEYYESVFAEVCIKTDFPLTSYIIDLIEDEAKLKLNGPRTSVSEANLDNYISGNKPDIGIKDTYIVFFSMRSLETCVNLDDENLIDRLYSDNINLTDMPETLQEKVLFYCDYILDEHSTVTFKYENHNFKIKNEGERLYSLFDRDGYLTVPHLTPFYYKHAKNYNGLPIAQFSI